MFLHLYKYRLIHMIRTKEILFWNILFPLLLGTIFYAGFSNLLNGNDIKMEPIQIAVVTDEENTTFTQVLDQLSEDNDDQLFDATYTDREHASQLLIDDSIDAVIVVKEHPSIIVRDEGMNQSITQTFVNQYETQADTIHTIIKEHPEKLSAVIDQLSNDVSYNHETSVARGHFDPYLQYFFALIAMTCLFATSSGADSVNTMQANISVLGMRREAAPAHKLVVMFSDFLATVTLQTIGIILMFVYLIYVLGINFGDRIPLVILTGIIGSVTGIAFGIFFASVIPASKEVKSGVCMTFSMLCSFLSGLMISTIKNDIEHTCPIVNKLNPAALISDALYSLSMYESYQRFLTDIFILIGMILALCMISYLVLRRNKYASL